MASKQLLEISEQDLDLLEARVAEIERHLGIEDIDDERALEAGDFSEPIIKKAQTCAEFMNAMEGKFFMFKELYKKVEQLRAFLDKDPHTAQGQNFKSLCLDMQKKTALIRECQEEIIAFVECLKELRNMESYLSFEPIYDVSEKLAELEQLKKIHLGNLIANDENSTELEQAI